MSDLHIAPKRIEKLPPGSADRIATLIEGEPVTTWTDPRVVESMDIEIVARCLDRTTPCPPSVPPKRDLELIAAEVDRLALPAINPCCARASARVLVLLKGQP